MIPFLAELKTIRDETEATPAWNDNEFSPPTVCLNIGINDFTTAINITPPQAICTIGFRPMPETDTGILLERIRCAAEKQGIEYRLENHHEPFRRDPQSGFAQTCVDMAGGLPPRTVGYGTEASNFTEIEDLVVLGPGDIAQAHKSDEWISLEQLKQGEETYRKLIRRFCL
jgi:acetylornithine deacetylase